MVSVLAGPRGVRPSVAALVFPCAAWISAPGVLQGREVVVVVGKLCGGVVVAEPFPGG
jgi:hypothetical protein